MCIRFTIDLCVATEIPINYNEKGSTDIENANACDPPYTVQHSKCSVSNFLKSPVDSDSKSFLLLQEDFCDIS